MNGNTQYNQNNQSEHFELDLATGRLTQQSATRYFSRFGWFAFTMTIVIQAVVLLVSLAFMVVYPKAIDHFAFGNILNFLAIYAIALPCGLPFLRKLPYEKPIPVKMPIGKFFIGFCICMALMTVGSNISQTFFTLMQNLYGTATENPVAVAVSSVPWWFNLLTTVILAPILEEILFRYIICTRLSALGEGFAIFLSASFFALIHGNFYQVFYAFLIGAFLAFIYIKTGKLRYTIIYHILINFFGGFVAPFIVERVDFDVLASGDVAAIASNAVPFMLLLLYEAFVLTVSTVGIVMVIVKRREFTLHKGILQPPERWASPLFLNGGIAAAIAMLGLNLVWSLGG
ncbi:MAG: CPBP family intramembrane metalloprotease [Ruminococcaceae bacterium]|nr:CPBP family intramembrane metalloprotease [Oscillospiraceae bacterium]